MESTLLSRADLAAELGISVRTLDRMRSRGELPCVVLGKRIVKFRPRISDDIAAAREEPAGSGRDRDGAGKAAAPERQLAPLRPLPRGGRRFLPPHIEQARRERRGL